MSGRVSNGIPGSGSGSGTRWALVANNQKAPLGSLVMVLELNIGFESVAGHQLSDGYLETSFHLALCYMAHVLISCPSFFFTIL